MHFIYGYNTIWPIVCMTIIWFILIVIGVLLVRSFIKGSPKSKSSIRKRLEKGQMDK